MPEQTTPSEIVFTREDIEGTVSGRFDRIASLYADKEALVGPEGRLTYRELQTSVDRLAATIQHHTPR